MCDGPCPAYSCLDIVSPIIGNVLWLLTVKRRIFGGDTMKARVARLQQDLHEWYRRTKCTSRVQGQITVEALRSDGSRPKLRAKAAASRHLAPYALMLIEVHMDGSVHDREAVVVRRWLMEFYTLIQQESMLLSVEARGWLPALDQTLCVLYSSL